MKEEEGGRGRDEADAQAMQDAQSQDETRDKKSSHKTAKTK